MKKFLGLFLVIIMVFGLCGCFGESVDDIRGDITSNTVQDDDTPEFSLGKTANNTYTNKFLDLSCTLPADWVFYTDEQILELNNMVGDVIDEDVAERLKDSAIIYDMFATCQTDNSNINVVLEKLNTSQLLSLDLKQSLEAQISGIESSYQNMGYTDINVKYRKITVQGKEFDGLNLTAKIEGIDFYANIFTFRKGSYLANVTICSIQTDKTDTILDYFTVK